MNLIPIVIELLVLALCGWLLWDDPAYALPTLLAAWSVLRLVGMVLALDR